MASTTINGITLTYPDGPSPVFNPCIFLLTGTMARAKAQVVKDGVSYHATYQLPNGGRLDLRQYLQMMFDGIGFGKELDSMGNFKVSEFGKNVTVSVTAMSADGTTLAEFSVTVFCVWGGVAVGEELVTDEAERITWYRNFPLTVGVYAPSSKSLSYDCYSAVGGQGVHVRTISLPSQGLYNVAINADNGINTREIHISDTASPYTKRYIVTIDRTHTDGVYLRWIDRHGFWRYRLFKAGDPTRTSSSRFGMYHHNDLTDYDPSAGWQGRSGRRQSFSRNDIQPLCAPLVSQKEFDMLQDITTSPCVDMFIGYDGQTPKWTAVTVEAGSYTKDVDKPEQDFLLNLVKPEIPVQS